MDKHDASFDEWFDVLAIYLLAEGFQFSDKDAVREDFDAGRNVYDVIDEIKAEYE